MIPTSTGNQDLLSIPARSLTGLVSEDAAALFSKRLREVLDKTSRYVYSTFEAINCKLMAIEFEHKGTTYRVDTIAELREVRAELDHSDRDPERQFIDRVLDFWTSDRFMDVMLGLNDSQRNLLLAIYQRPNLTGRELAAALGLDSEFALAGVISGLSKQLKPMEIDLEQILTIKVKWTGKTKTRRFMLEDFFVSAGAVQGWPDAWGGNLKDTKRTKRAVKNSRATKNTKAGE